MTPNPFLIGSPKNMSFNLKEHRISNSKIGSKVLRKTNKKMIKIERKNGNKHGFITTSNIMNMNHSNINKSKFEGYQIFKKFTNEIEIKSNLQI